MTDQPPRGQKPRRGLASELVHDILKNKLEAREHSQATEDKRVQRHQRARQIVFFVLLPLFVAAMGWNLTVGRKPPVVFTQAEIDASTRFRIFLAAQAVRAYRDSAGQWPQSLAAAGFAGEGLTYQLVDTSYVINATSGGVLFTYRAGADLGYFRDAAQELLK
jgi:hypothetical protein